MRFVSRISFILSFLILALGVSTLSVLIVGYDDPLMHVQEQVIQIEGWNIKRREVNGSLTFYTLSDEDCSTSLALALGYHLYETEKVALMLTVEDPHSYIFVSIHDDEEIAGYRVNVTQEG